MDHQFLGIILAVCVLLAAIPFTSFTSMPLVWQIAIALVALAVVWLFDVLTVRLVEAGRWRGLLGYATTEKRE